MFFQITSLVIPPLCQFYLLTYEPLVLNCDRNLTLPPQDVKYLYVPNTFVFIYLLIDVCSHW